MVQNTDKVPAKSKKHPVLKVLLVSFALVLLVAAGSAWYGWTWLQNQLGPAGDSESPILITIPRGATSAEVG